jgi:hypothetical protein
LKIGFYDSEAEKGSYSEIPSPTITQTDSANKTSYVNISFNEAYKIDKLYIYTSGPELYYRNTTIGINKHIKNEQYFQPLHAFNITSDSKSAIDISLLNSKAITLQIANNDNTPLHVDSIKAWQLNMYLLAQLKKNEDYYICFGNSKLELPEYDLKYFTDTLNIKQPIVATGEIINLKSDIKVKSTIFNTKVFMWVSIVIIAALLLFFTIKVQKNI